MITDKIWFDDLIQRQDNFFAKKIDFPDELDYDLDLFFNKVNSLYENLKQDYDTEYEDDFFSDSNKKKNEMVTLIIEGILNITVDGLNRDSEFYINLLDSFIFTSLCDFINKTKRVGRLTNEEALSKYYTGTRWDGTKFKADFDETEMNNIRKKTQRLRKDKGTYNKNTASGAISLDLAYEFSYLYEIMNYDLLERQWSSNRKFVDKKLAETYKRIGNVNNDIRNALINNPKDLSNYELNKIEKTFLSKIKKIKFEDFCEFNKYCLSKICENKEYYGINLYRFEKNFKYYGIINEMNKLSRCKGTAMQTIAIKKFSSLSEIYFSKVYEDFYCIENFEAFSIAINMFKSFRDQVSIISRLILDKFVEDGYFGDGDEWYDFFRETTNDMAEKVLYDPEKFDYQINPESQELFEQILYSQIDFDIYK